MPENEGGWAIDGGLAHDFNNLLAVIIGSLELTDSASPDAAAHHSCAQSRGTRAMSPSVCWPSRASVLQPHAVEMKPLLGEPERADAALCFLPR